MTGTDAGLCIEVPCFEVALASSAHAAGLYDEVDLIVAIRDVSA